ncbi:Hypothetical protein D823_02546 [Streptococcus sobrinus DSM 20742 = ATCC 33478]|nr:Hypothetical protein D823_02546 [Streptococcus sobrinus DSM 20742 = ATCC 33478]
MVKILVSDPDMESALLATLDKMIDEDSEIVTIYIGQDGQKELVEKLTATLEDKYEEIEVEVHQGDQPVYPYLLSVE